MEFRQCSVSGIKYEEVGGVLCTQSDIPGVAPTPLAKFPVSVSLHSIKFQLLLNSHSVPFHPIGGFDQVSSSPCALPFTPRRQTSQLQLRKLQRDRK